MTCFRAAGISGMVIRETRILPSALRPTATLKVPNDGSLRFAIPGDGYDEPFPRTITWTDDDVKNGVVEKKLPILRGRRTP